MVQDVRNPADTSALEKLSCRLTAVGASTNEKANPHMRREGGESKPELGVQPALTSVYERRDEAAAAAALSGV